MGQHLKLLFVTLFTLSMCTVQAMPAKDAKGCKDSPLVTRFPGSMIDHCRDRPDETHVFEMESGKPQKKLEGEFHEIGYAFPETASKSQVIRNLRTALQSAGYIFDYDAGEHGGFTSHLGKTWIGGTVSASGNYTLYILLETQLTQDIVADAAALSSGLTGAGHIVVHGILFKTGKSTVKPESTAALDEISKLLKQDDKLKLYVVGHTDNVGELSSNLELSRQRAAAVLQVLTTKYGVVANRLQAFGNGPYAPITSNDTEDGRTLNRRVELVKQ